MSSSRAKWADRLGACSLEAYELQSELEKSSTNITLVERVLGNLGGIASIAILVEQVKPFLNALLPEDTVLRFIWLSLLLSFLHLFLLLLQPELSF